MVATQPILYAFIRVDTHDNDVITSFLRLYIDTTTYCVLHKGSEGENPHFHLLAKLTQVTTLQTLRNWVKKHFNTEKDGFCVKEWKRSEEDDSKLYSYPYHETEAKFIINNLTQEQISRAQKDNQIIQARIKVIKDNQEKKDKGKTKYQIIEELRQELDAEEIQTDHYSNGDVDYPDVRHNFRNICNKIIDKFNKERVIFGIFEIEKIFITLVSNKPKWKEIIMEKIHSKLFN